MPILLAMDLPIQSEVPLELFNFLPPDSSQQAVPSVSDGSLERFDPVERAVELAATLSRQWCGTYKSFGDEPQVDVTLNLAKVVPIGQIIDLRGEMRLGSVTTPVQGNLNAKSTQLELLPLADQLIPGMEPGGLFLGLQDFTLSGWQANRLGNPGGTLNLSSSCAVQAQASEPLPIRGLW
ncbi:MAG: hypothetical protein AB8A40_05360 [Prochlorococcus sp.]|jgi:hypothetical protein|nr:hypothetical protein [Prochlorococcaceae cyanobacterium ETNP18_MAG_14]MDP6310168.1 hypothetical protein [Prochlorococcaceae cyanobacterium ETNP14_MAG_4]|tara:strand:+ start:484 stop:1023 length:540 start_codon:yes stop_codon:yes gene_type:complete